MAPGSSYTPAPASDFVLPFNLAEVGLRGRLVRLDSACTRALSAHKLPEPAQRIVAEKLALKPIKVWYPFPRKDWPLPLRCISLRASNCRQKSAWRQRQSTAQDWAMAGVPAG